jgi:hypothetical protein
MRHVIQQVDHTLNRLLQASLEQTLKASAPGANWRASRVENLDAVRHDQCILLTISSFKFRIMCLLHASMDGITRQFALDTSAGMAADLDDSGLKDWLLEMSNSFCGTLKRNLQSSCPPLGMSTPNFIERTSISHYSAITFAHSAHATAKAGDSGPALFAVSALVSTAAPGAFRLDHYHEFTQHPTEEGESSGELELF